MNRRFEKFFLNDFRPTFEKRVIERIIRTMIGEGIEYTRDNKMKISVRFSSDDFPHVKEGIKFVAHAFKKVLMKNFKDFFFLFMILPDSTFIITITSKKKYDYLLWSRQSIYEQFLVVTDKMLLELSDETSVLRKNLTSEKIFDIDIFTPYNPDFFLYAKIFTFDWEYIELKNYIILLSNIIKTHCPYLMTPELDKSFRSFLFREFIN